MKDLKIRRSVRSSQSEWTLLISSRLVCRQVTRRHYFLCQSDSLSLPSLSLCLSVSIIWPFSLQKKSLYSQLLICMKWKYPTWKCVCVTHTHTHICIWMYVCISVCSLEIPTDARWLPLHQWPTSTLRGREGGGERGREMGGGHLLDEWQLQYSVWCHTHSVRVDRWLKQCHDEAALWYDTGNAQGVPAKHGITVTAVSASWVTSSKQRDVNGCWCSLQVMDNLAGLCEDVPLTLCYYLLVGEWGFWQWAPGEEHSD